MTITLHLNYCITLIKLCIIEVTSHVVSALNGYILFYVFDVSYFGEINKYQFLKVVISSKNAVYEFTNLLLRWLHLFSYFKLYFFIISW